METGGGEMGTVTEGEKQSTTSIDASLTSDFMDKEESNNILLIASSRCFV